MQTTLEYLPEDVLRRKASPLANALVEAGIRPLDPETVEAYKAEMVEAHPPSFWWIHQVEVERVVCRTVHLLAILLLLSVLTLVISGAGWAIASLLDDVSNAVYAIAILKGAGISGATSFVCLVGVIYASEKLTIREPAFWIPQRLAIHLTSDMQKIPDKAQKMVDDIEQHLPLDEGFPIGFKVEELVQDKVPLDPFLAVFDLETGEEYYIFQWD